MRWWPPARPRATASSCLHITFASRYNIPAFLVLLSRAADRDTLRTRAAARAALGDAAFGAAYQSAADLTYGESLDLARTALSAG